MQRESTNWSLNFLMTKKHLSAFHVEIYVKEILTLTSVKIQGIVSNFSLGLRLVKNTKGQLCNWNKLSNLSNRIEPCLDCNK